MPRLFASSLLFSLLALLVACDPNQAPDDNGVSDKAYLAAFCTSLDHYSDTLARADDAPAIEAAMRDYIAALQAIRAPRDLARFHADFVAYVAAGLAEPSARVGRPAPRPQEKVADRIAAAEGAVDECQEASYFGEE
ncbi:MAG: hypothetical protein ACR2HN_09405 [Tepidiformaceae bacterium]